jgi:hypothetical protein
MIGIFGDHHMSQQRGPCQATIYRPMRRRLPHDAVAAIAAEFGTHRADDLEAGRSLFQGSGHILA